MISFSLAQTNGLLGGHLQLHCMRLLQSCKSLAANSDATGGQVGKLAAKGITSLSNLGAKNIIFVVDLVCRLSPDGKTLDECDFLLGGKFFRLVTQHKPNPNGKHSWDSYVPVSIVPIAQPRSMANAQKLVAKPQPAPMNQVALPQGAMAPQPTGFYATITGTTPTSNDASMTTVMPNHYASMADIVAKPDTGFYATV